MIDIGKQKVSINCPSCNKSIHVSLAQISKQETIKCSGCNQEIELQDKGGSFKKGIRESNNAFKKLENTFKKLGKK